jgi:RNA polymerase sigma factor (sigma-70 family)
LRFADEPMGKDNLIWDEFRNDKDFALSHIYRENIDFLFSYGKKFSRDEDFILDVIQDLFCDLIKYRKKLGETDNIRWYLMKSFRRKLLRGIEHKKRSTKRDGYYSLEPEIVFSIEEELITDEVQARKVKLIREGIKELSKKQREVIYYKFTLGYDYSQICEIMSITYESARQMVSRAVNLLRRYLAENKLFLMMILNLKKI